MAAAAMGETSTVRSGPQKARSPKWHHTLGSVASQTRRLRSNASVAPASTRCGRLRCIHRSLKSRASTRCASRSAITATKLIWNPGRRAACGSSSIRATATQPSTARGVKWAPSSAATPATIAMNAARVAEMSGCTASAKRIAPVKRRIDRPRCRSRNQRPSHSRPPARIATLNPLMATRCVRPVTAKSARAGLAPSRSVPITMHARIDRDSTSGQGRIDSRSARPVCARARHRTALSQSSGPAGEACPQPSHGTTSVPPPPRV